MLTLINFGTKLLCVLRNKKTSDLECNTIRIRVFRIFREQIVLVYKIALNLIHGILEKITNLKP